MKYLNKEMLCKIGIHDKEIAGDELFCFNYIKKCLKPLKPYTTINRHFFMDFDAERIYTNIYSSRMKNENKVVQDYVCLRCGKCFENIKFEKFMLKENVLKYLSKMKDKETRKQMAKDLYKNCHN